MICSSLEGSCVSDGYTLSDMKIATCVHALHVGILNLKSQEFSPEPPHSNIHKLPKKDNQMYNFLIFNAKFLRGNPVVFWELSKFKLPHVGIFCLISCLGMASQHL